MDSLTHLVAGALTPLAFRGTPKRVAVIAFGIAVGELPDIDILFGTGAQALLALHRGITHALAWQPVFVLVAVLPFYIWLQNRSARMLPLPDQAPVRQPLPDPGPSGLGAFSLGRMWLIALLATVTHIYLDCMTTFGTQALLPFSGVRVAFPAMFIVDLLLTLPALALLVYALRRPPDIVPPSLPRWRGSAVPAPARSGYAFVSGRSRRIARIALAWILVYPLLSLGVNQAATVLLTPRLTGLHAETEPLPAPIFAEDATPRKTEAGRLLLMTEPFSPFVWKAIVDEGDHWRTGTLRLYAADSARLERVYAKPNPVLYERLKKQVPLFAMFEEFAPLMVQMERPAGSLTQREYQNGVKEYVFVDLRYLMAPDSPARLVGRTDPNFVLEARVNGEGGLVAYRFLHSGKDTDTPWALLE